MSSTKHRGKVWRFSKRITLPDGTKIRITGKGPFNTAASCDQAEHDEIEKLLHPERVKREPEPEPERDTKTIGDLITGYLAQQVEGRPSSNRTRAGHLRGQVAAFFGKLPIDGLKQSHLNAFRDAHRSDAAQTIKNKLYALFAVLEWAADDEQIPRHGLRVKVKARHAKKEIDINAVPPAGVLSLLDAASRDPRYLVAISLASNEGLRIGEIRGMQWTDIHAHEVIVRRDIDDRNNIGPPKNGCERSVPLTSGTKTALAKLAKLPKRGIWLLTRLDDSPGGRKGMKRASPPGGFMGYSGLNKGIKTIYRRAGITFTEDTGIHVWHSLRHSYGTALVAGGVIMERVMLLMGHSDIRTTQRYITTTKEQLARDVARTFG